MTIRWGIVSARKICSDFVNAFNSYEHKGDQAIVAVAARNRAKAKEFAETHNISLYFGSYQEMASSSDIDVVYIGALNPFHFDLAKLYLTNGKHVLCEIPLCMNRFQVASLIDIARKERRFLMEGVWSRFTPAYLEMEKEIKSGKIGEVMFLEANFGFYTEADRISKKEYGASATLDAGAYSLQLALFVFKEIPKSVNVSGTLNEQGVDISETIVLEYKGGERAVLNSHTRLELCNQATVYGTKGRITAPCHFPDKMISSDGSVKNFELHPSKYPYNFQNSASRVYGMLEVARCIKEDVIESAWMTHEESINIATIQDTIRNTLGVDLDCDYAEYPCSFVNLL